MGASLLALELGRARGCEADWDAGLAHLPVWAGGNRLPASPYLLVEDPPWKDFASGAGTVDPLGGAPCEVSCLDHLDVEASGAQAGPSVGEVAPCSSPPSDLSPPDRG
mmetsp:Transcript_14801/g.19521  ORF Transcript_14801/g.19521 Transcript_14801/m.19521 type:complete len:108 (-) Transcript_14801:318-641(-)